MPPIKALVGTAVGLGVLLGLLVNYLLARALRH